MRDSRTCIFLHPCTLTTSRSGQNLARWKSASSAMWRQPLDMNDFSLVHPSAREATPAGVNNSHQEMLRYWSCNKQERN